MVNLRYFSGERLSLESSCCMIRMIEVMGRPKSEFHSEKAMEVPRW